MITKEQLQKVISDQGKTAHKDRIVTRTIQIPQNKKRIIIITGVRRCGKSTLLKTSVGKNQKSIYLSFEDPRLEGFEMRDFLKLEEIAVESGKKQFLFDEIQNISQWEKYVRSAHDRGLSIYITGSNASLLSRELGTRLTGRYSQYELFPFDYQEFLNLREMTAGPESFSDYLHTGGFPEYLLEPDDDYLRLLLKDIIIRDIAVRRKIRNEGVITRLAIHLLSNIGKQFSYNNLTKLLEISSVRSTIDYCNYLQESYLLEIIPVYSKSIKKQIANPKKVYCIDTAMARANSLSFSEDRGRMLENSIYLHLRRSHSDIMYFRNNNSECDFLVRKNEKVLTAIQVCWHLNDTNLERELKGIQDAMIESGAREGMIITFDQEDELQGISVIPAWKWMSGVADGRNTD